MASRLMMITATLVSVSLVMTVSNWKADTANAKISFTVEGPFGTVDGKFSGLQATIQFDEKDPAAGSLSASVDAATISTGIGWRNRDLRKKEEWFNTDKYPRIAFRSKKIEKTGSGFNAIGELTIKGISTTVTIPFSFTSKENTGLFKGQFSIRRQDFQLGNSGGSVGNEVKITLEVPVKK
ncbi:MAG: YceI family protein [Bacteroidota bacterium]